MVGAIIIWSGTLLDIPIGWRLCDGTNGTKNLKNLFVIGAHSALPPDSSGGSISHTHTFEGDGHKHQADGSVDAGDGGEEAWDHSDSSETGKAEGTTDGGGGYPPYYALAYIQRLV